MALNWVMLSPDRTPVPLPNEQIITAIDSGAELSITIPDAPPTDPSAKSGGSGGSLKMKEAGSVYLTDQRLIYVTPAPSTGPSPSFDSISIPLPSILSTRFEQPLLGLNYLSFIIKPVSGGGFTDGTSAELRLKDRAMFQFVSMLEKTRERAIYMKRQSVLDEDEGLPMYSSVAGSSAALPPGNNNEVPDDRPPEYTT